MAQSQDGPGLTTLLREAAMSHCEQTSHRPNERNGTMTSSTSLGDNLMPNDSLVDLTTQVRDFADARDWQQFHSPKNLAAAMTVEAGEVLEHFQWLTEAESESLGPEKRSEVELELADVLIYLVRLADRLGVDLIAAAARKIAINAEKYPVDQAKGSNKKYTER